MNGFTTTETDATDTGRRARDAERVQMALHEAGFPELRVTVGDNGRIRWDGPYQGGERTHARVVAWMRAMSLIGRSTRCLPCNLFAVNQLGLGPRVSPDCEGTGRCAVES